MTAADAVAANLARVVRRHAYAFGIAATRDGTVLATAGSTDALESDDLRRLLFGDAAAIAGLYASLDGQLLPRLWAQGATRCAVFRPAAGVLVGVFARSERSNAQLYQEFASIGRELTAGVA